MAAPSLTYNVLGSSASQSLQINKDFKDLIDALTLGTSDLFIGSLWVGSGAGTGYSGASAVGVDISYGGVDTLTLGADSGL